MMALRKKISAFWAEEAPAALVQHGYRNDGGTIAASSAGNRDPSMPLAPPTIAITPEHYNRIYRLVDKKIPVKLELEVRNLIGDTNDDSFNVVADIPGTGKHKDEVVIIGGHLDSWHGGTGATDNGAGSAVMMEVIRVLTELKLPLDRTVRIALWSGEEQGLLGSRAYVKERFADPATMKTTSEWEKVSAYYNIDNGAGKIRGIYLQGNEAARPVFESLLAPFKDMDAATVTIKNTTGTDHQAFDAVGLPGFQFIQDPLEYSTRTHHSNMDVYDRVQRGDLVQMSTIMTSLVYHTANRDQKIPRKVKPEPRPAGRGMMGF
jgi:Zn-dependent M28 family amino/carboxypeptidase